MSALPHFPGYNIFLIMSIRSHRFKRSSNLSTDAHDIRF
ncbi:hypothetical protein LINPERHAP1_LOCUS22706 [Linum perenne]